MQYLSLPRVYIKNDDANTMARTAAALLRQLANSDALKAAIVEAGGMDVVADAMRQYADDIGVLEQVRSGYSCWCPHYVFGRLIT